MDHSKIIDTFKTYQYPGIDLARVFSTQGISGDPGRIPSYQTSPYREYFHQKIG